MHVINRILVCLCCVGFFSYGFGQIRGELKPLVIVIDPGHGGKDAGAISRTGVKEKDIVLSIANKMVELNYRLNKQPLDIFLTRYTDTFVSLADRTRLSKKLKADVFISIHCNASANPKASGTEVYIYPKSEMQAEESAYLGFTIQKGLANTLGFKNRGVKFGDFQVLRDSRAECVTVLLEIGFLSHVDEARYLLKEEVQGAVALVVLEMVID
ncbi:N-acetylmuramoyl-L-alanine amidase family protein [Algibacter lectus]|uniref:N-acetylmuramoyl-L-alanine amidase family protein n=1 Tax=Algibacter lectus TaxID=221126 RepID=UPI0026EC9E68|nr:N-acetylmuramoyl-L-alanine amidase [Algibacter lectus]MDO7136045.1 N-acetylmuramoyl-L-alanine amidase [Algibacter lectus]